jgi:hypothetical protein
MSTVNPYVPPSGPSMSPSAGPPPLVPPQPGSSLDFGRTLTFFFQDPSWVQKMLIGSLFTILSMFLIGSVFVAGYAARLVRRAARGEPHPLPEWDDLGGMFAEGLSVVGAYLLHLLPVMAAFGILFVPVILMSERDGDPSPAAALLLVLLVILAVVMVFALLFYFTAAFTRLALEERFGAAFEVQENLSYIQRNTGNLLMALLAFIVSNFIAQFGILLFCVGILPATFWSQCVGAYALGDVAFRDPGRRRQ